MAETRTRAQLIEEVNSLRQTEESYRAVVENSLDAMTIIVGTERVFVNNAFLKLVGVEKSEIGNISVGRFIAPEDRDQVIQRTLARQRGEPIEDVFEYQVLRSDGQRRTVQASAVAIDYQNQPASMAILRDVTDYKRAQAELEVLFRISSILSGSGTFEDKLNNVMEELARVSEAAWASIFVQDDQAGGLRTIVEVRKDGSAPPTRRGIRGFALTAYEKGQVVVVNEYQSNPNADRSVKESGAKSTISLPIKAGGTTVAVAYVCSNEDANHFNPDRTRLLTAIADGLGDFLESARLQGQLLQRSEELEALFKISGILAEPGAHEDKLNGVMQELARIAEVYWVSLLVPDPTERGLSPLVRVADAPALRLVHGLSLAAFEKGQAMVANDYQSYPDADPRVIARGAKSLLSLPIKVSEETFGVAAIVSDEPDHFNPERVRLLTAIVNGLGPILEKAKLSEELHARTEEMAAVDEIARILTSTLEIDQVYDRFTSEVKKLVDFDRIGISLIDQHAGTSIIKFTSGIGPSSDIGTPRILHNIRLGGLVASGKTVVVDDLEAEPELSLDRQYIEAGLSSLIIVPLVSHAQIIGAIDLRGRRTGSFGKREQMILERLANQIAPAFENSQLYETSRKRRAELEALFNISTIFAAPGTHEDKLNGVMQELLRVADADWMKLLVPGLNGKGLATFLVSLAAGGKDLPSDTELQQRPAAFAMGVMESGKSMVENDYQSRPDTDPTAIADGLKSLIALPIKGTEGTLGVAAVASRQAHHFNPERVRLLTAIVDGFGNFLEKARLDQDLIDSNRHLLEALDTLRATQEHLVHQERLSALGTMASGIAHDFNNALSPILGYSEFLLEAADQFDEPHRQVPARDQDQRSRRRSGGQPAAGVLPATW